MPTWLQWGFWLSPLSYGEIGVTVNEFLAPRWEKVMFDCSNDHSSKLESLLLLRTRCLYRRLGYLDLKT